MRKKRYRKPVSRNSYKVDIFSESGGLIGYIGMCQEHHVLCINRKNRFEHPLVFGYLSTHVPRKMFVKQARAYCQQRNFRIGR